MVNKLKQVSLNDWTGLYVNGKLKTEGHSFQDNDYAALLAELQPFEFEHEWLEGDEADVLNDLGGSLPESLIQLESALSDRRAWPKRITMYFHDNYTFSEFMEVYAEEAGISEAFAEKYGLGRMAYEVGITYEIQQDGSYKIVEVDGKKVCE